MSSISDARNIKNEREMGEKEREELQKWLEKVWGVELESSMPVETEDEDDNSSQ